MNVHKYCTTSNLDPFKNNYFLSDEKSIRLTALTANQETAVQGLLC